jgi:hypothetical protein
MALVPQVVDALKKEGKEEFLGQLQCELFAAAPSFNHVLLCPVRSLSLPPLWPVVSAYTIISRISQDVMVF